MSTKYLNSDADHEKLNSCVDWIRAYPKDTEPAWEDPANEWMPHTNAPYSNVQVPLIPVLKGGMPCILRVDPDQAHWSFIKPRVEKASPERLALRFFGGLFTQKLERFHATQPSAESEEDLLVAGQNLIDLLDELNDLAYDAVEDDHGLIRPSYYSIKHAMRFLLRLARKSALLRPNNITTDNNGDIHISWGKGDRELDLICPYEESEQPYLYYSSGGPKEFGVDANTDIAHMARRIRWAVLGA